jgi:hypothetical protein
MTGLAIVGFVLVGVLVVLVAAAFAQQTVRDLRGLKGSTVRVRFSWNADSDSAPETPHRPEDGLQLLAEKNSRERPDPDVPSGWGFD